jgi:mannose-1-phosphate guanylyltransferase
MLHALIMAGGGGTRFWPRSRARKPKQFLTLSGESTLLQQTVERIESVTAADNTWIITAAAHQQECGRQLPQLPATNIIGEPCGRDTAPCIAVGAALIARRDPEAVMLVMPADHVIEPAQEFRRTAHVASQMAIENPHALVTLGITPNYPATGYGYIHRGAEHAVRQGLAVFRVRSFREKPSFDVAQAFLASGEYYWNSGIFVWRAATILQAIKENQPSLYDGAQRIARAWGSPQREQVMQTEYPGLTKISIDFAVMEKAKEVLVVHAPYRWDDVGSWLALERLNPQDEDRNTLLAPHVGIRTRNCVIVGDPGRLIATIGVENLLIIQDGDALLVADRRDEGAVKDLVNELRARGLEAYL